MILSRSLIAINQEQKKDITVLNRLRKETRRSSIRVRVDLRKTLKEIKKREAQIDLVSRINKDSYQREINKARQIRIRDQKI